MDTLSNVLSVTMGVRVVLLLLLLLLFVYVMARNYGRLRLERLHAEWSPAERPIDRVLVDWRFLTTDTVLTARRVIQARASWLLAKRKLKVIDLTDVHSVVWRRYTNWFLLLAGLYFAGTLNPIALFLFLLGLQEKVYSIRFATPAAQMPVTRIVVTSPWRRQLGEIRRFYGEAVAAWSRIRGRHGDPDPGVVGPTVKGLSVGEDDVDRDFVWGRAVLSYTAVFMILAAIQRIVNPHVAYDDILFGALYLGIPVAVARRSARDAAWTALLGFAGLRTVKFPSGGLLALVTNDGGVPAFTEYALVLAGLETIVGLAALVSKYVHAGLNVLALVTWLGVVRVIGSDLVQDFALYTTILFAMAAAMVVAPVDRRLAVRVA